MVQCYTEGRKALVPQVFLTVIILDEAVSELSLAEYAKLIQQPSD